MTILFQSLIHDPDLWIDALQPALPDEDIRPLAEIDDKASVDAAIVLAPPHGLLASLPNLKFVQNLGAGVDGLLKDPSYPRHLPLARMVDDGLANKMAEYVVLHVLRYHRQVEAMQFNQRNKIWKWLPPVDASERCIGIMGMGELGVAAAKRLLGFSFQVVSWSRRLKAIDGVASFHGADQLEGFLRHCQMLVCLLPLTPETTGIINRRTLSLLPRGAYVINAGRGGHVAEHDLLHALDNDYIAGATLDVFAEEPLRQDHPFWVHPKVTVTPHNAADIIPSRVVPYIADNIRRLREGRPLLRLVDMKTGY
ncbi:glyoxylate/hydroxypyruvate reductase A [Ferrovibrio sp.]|uniref:2-hydroxyacid dehydrogenase n=1 Tax=Ferrovibrio sp. TaxID=1917215 RepID=UPI0025BCB2DF|nr:glyoxylate/hydroxypyruvate reductase A [Ferrovibrio sp.]MBX3456465.1 glyoxylate/hydroxypyruvate reductase A [Ferrovibrio sp.]